MLVFTTLVQPDDRNEVGTVLEQLFQLLKAPNCPDFLREWYKLKHNCNKGYVNSLFITKTVHSGLKVEGWWFDVTWGKDTYHVFVKRQLRLSCIYHTDGSDSNLGRGELRKYKGDYSLYTDMSTVFHGKVTSPYGTWEWKLESGKWEYTDGPPEGFVNYKASAASRSSKASSVASSNVTNKTEKSAASNISRRPIPTTVDDKMSDEAPSRSYGKTKEGLSTNSEPPSSTSEKKVAFKDGSAPIPAPREALSDVTAATSQTKELGAAQKQTETQIARSKSEEPKGHQGSPGRERRKHKSGDPQPASCKQATKPLMRSAGASGPGEAQQLAQNQQMQSTSGNIDDCLNEPREEEGLIPERQSSQSDGTQGQEVVGRKKKNRSIK